MSVQLDIMRQFASMLEADIKLVTKRFAPTIESEVTAYSIKISGSEHIQTLIDGRPPTSSNPQRGPKTLQQIIYTWIGKKGIKAQAQNGKKAMNRRSLSWAISTSIHKHGDLLYQRGGGNNIFEGIITQSRINTFTNSIASHIQLNTSS